MATKFRISAGFLIALTDQAAALSPPVAGHQSAPPRIAEPGVLMGEVPAPVAVPPPYCPVPFPYVEQPVIEQGRPHILYWQHQPDAALQHGPDAPLPPIETTPIQ